MGDQPSRNLADRVIDALNAQVKANQRSLGGEVRYLLAHRFDRRDRTVASERTPSGLPA